MKRTEVFNYVKEKYQTEPEYLWIKFPRYAVLRHGDNHKWYALIMDVEKNKLGEANIGKEDIMDVKLSPEKVASLSEFSEFLPAYYMNKTHWLFCSLRANFRKRIR